jgi:hypothetical protein
VPEGAAVAARRRQEGVLPATTRRRRLRLDSLRPVHRAPRPFSRPLAAQLKEIASATEKASAEAAAEAARQREDTLARAQQMVRTRSLRCGCTLYPPPALLLSPAFLPTRRRLRLQLTDVQSKIDAWSAQQAAALSENSALIKRAQELQAAHEAQERQHAAELRMAQLQLELEQAKHAQVRAHAPGLVGAWVVHADSCQQTSGLIAHRNARSAPNCTAPPARPQSTALLSKHEELLGTARVSLDRLAADNAALSKERDGLLGNLNKLMAVVGTYKEDGKKVRTAAAAAVPRRGGTAKGCVARGRRLQQPCATRDCLPANPLTPSRLQFNKKLDEIVAERGKLVQAVHDANAATAAVSKDKAVRAEKRAQVFTVDADMRSRLSRFTPRCSPSPSVCRRCKPRWLPWRGWRARWLASAPL